MIARVEWTRRALRNLTLWIAAFSRDEITLRANRRFHRREVRRQLLETDGRPPGSRDIQAPQGPVTVWEYTQGLLWVVVIRKADHMALWHRLLGRNDEAAFIVEVLRHDPTLPELEALLQ